MRASQPSFGSKMDQIFLKRMDLQVQIVCLLPAPEMTPRSVSAKPTIAKTVCTGKRETRESARSFRSATPLFRRHVITGPTSPRPSGRGAGKAQFLDSFHLLFFAVHAAPHGHEA